MNAEELPKTLYRLRPIKTVKEYKELEKQEIHFSSFKELNDPMEGFLNFYWKGDEIVWKNFFKNFITSLFVLNYWFRFFNENGSLNNKPIWIPQDINDIDFLRNKKELKILFDHFFCDHSVSKLMKHLLLKKDNIYIQEIIFILNLIVLELQQNINLSINNLNLIKYNEASITYYIDKNDISFKKENILRLKWLIENNRNIFFETEEKCIFKIYCYRFFI